MASTVYCYHCKAAHPREDMRMIVTKNGKRWRCVHSIEAAKADIVKRDAFGRKVSEKNKLEAQAKIRIRSNPVEPV